MNSVKNCNILFLLMGLLFSKSLINAALPCPATTVLAPPTLLASSKDAEPVTNSRELLKVVQNAEKGNMIRMTCTAPYPIELVHEKEKMNGIARHLGELIQIYYSNFSITSTYIFYIHVDFRINRQVPEGSDDLLFRCHSIENRCLQQTIVYAARTGESGELTFTISTNKAPVTNLDPLSDYPVGTQQEEECEAIFYFEEVDHRIQIEGLGQKIPSFSFRCEFLDGTPGKLIKRYCYTDVSGCSSILRGRRQPKHCVQPFILGQTCTICDTDFANEEVSDPSSMILMHKFNAVQSLHTELNVTCTASYYFNVASFQFAVQRGEGNDSKVEYMKPKTEESDIDWELRLDSKSQTMTIKFESVDITRIYCFGGTQHSFHWNVASRPVKVVDPHAVTVSRTPKILLDDLDPGYRKKGQNRGSEPSVVESTSETVLSDFDPENRKKSSQDQQNQVTQPSNGLTTPTEPTMLIKNLGTSWTEILIIIVPLIGVLLLIFCVVVTVLCHQNRKHRKALRNLTADEVRDFRHGNRSVDPNDLHASIHGTPFSTSLEIPRELLIIDDKTMLGSGQYGIVLLGRLTTKPVAPNNEEATTITVAVKTVRENVEVSHFKALLSEIKILAFIGQHQNIACMLGACTTDIEKRQVLAAIEFCGNGDLRNFILKRRHSFQNQFPGLSQEFYYANVDSIISNDNLPHHYHLTSTHLVTWSRDICNGMVYLSQKKVIHGDLALRNVLLTSQNVIKISDFGLSRQFVDYSNYVRKEQIPLPFKWLSIEALTNMEFSVQSDCWSFGITMWEIFSFGETPYPGYVWDHQFLEQLITGYRMKRPPQANDKLHDLMLDCWKRMPKDRPSFTQLYERLQNILEDLVAAQAQ